MYTHEIIVRQKCKAQPLFRFATFCEEEFLEPREQLG